MDVGCEAYVKFAFGKPSVQILHQNHMLDAYIQVERVQMIADQ